MKITFFIAGFIIWVYYTYHDVDYTGANTPPGDLLDLIAERNPHFVAISVGMPFNIDKTVELVKKIRGQRKFNDTKIMLGGQIKPSTKQNQPAATR